jgi:uncharacterized protein YndB with AHSA1/START domain
MTIAADETVLVLSRLFDAPAEQVFNAWLNREEWAAWIGPEGMSCDVPLLEPRVGGRYQIRMHTADGQTIPVAGTFTAIERPKLLAFTWGWEGDPARDSLVTLTFTRKGSSTELTLRQQGLGSITSRDEHGRGWNSALNKLERHLAAHGGA